VTSHNITTLSEETTVPCPTRTVRLRRCGPTQGLRRNTQQQVYRC
jgi:hypothetical protein